MSELYVVLQLLRNLRCCRINLLTRQDDIAGVFVELLSKAAGSRLAFIFDFGENRPHGFLNVAGITC